MSGWRKVRESIRQPDRVLDFFVFQIFPFVDLSFFNLPSTDLVDSV